MYICLNCAYKFETALCMEDKHLEAEGYVTEKYYICPACHSEDFEHTKVCKCCKEIIGETQARYGMCPICEEDTEESFEKLLQKNFTKKQIEYLNNQYEGKQFGIKERIEK